MLEERSGLLGYKELGPPAMMSMWYRVAELACKRAPVTCSVRELPGVAPGKTMRNGYRGRTQLRIPFSTINPKSV